MNCDRDQRDHSIKIRGLTSGGLLAYRSASDGAAAPLVTVGRDGRQIKILGRGYGPALSPDGVRIAVERIEPDTGTGDLWMIDPARRIDTPLTRHPAYDQNAVWSPDGLSLVFSSQREGPAKLFRAPASGNGPDERVADSATFNRPTDWSADGRFIAYSNVDPRTDLDLWALPLFGDRKPFAIARSEFGEAQGRFSPNGRWIAYSSDDSGQPEIFVQAFPVAGERWRISATGGSAPKWRRDGRELFYLGADGRLMVVPVTLADTPGFGAPVALFDSRLSNTNRGLAPYDVSADGQRFVLPAPSEASSRLTVVLNWAAGLPQ